MTVVHPSLPLLEFRDFSCDFVDRFRWGIHDPRNNAKKREDKASYSQLRDTTPVTERGRIRWLNSLSTVDAEAEFLKCCGSARWARAMTGARPFQSPDELLAKADGVWWSVSEEDWLQAFQAHPKIGEKKATAAQSERARIWSAQEQLGVERAAAKTKTALAKGNLEYEKRFSFIYIVCATGKTSEEMLANLNDRLQNAPETELRIAAEEQRKITRLRLEKLLNE